MPSRFSMLFTLGIIAGTINSLAIKFCFQTRALGIDGEEEYFQKPWFSSLVMFIAMTCALPLHYFFERNQKLPHQIPDEMVESKITWSLSKAIFFPSMCDMIGSSMQQIGLVYINLSIYQMLKGSILLFSAILSIIFLDRKLRTHNWIGLGVACVALSLVGFSSILSTTDDQAQGSSSGTLWTQLLGISVVIAGQVICASQYVVEEHLLKPPNTASPLVLVGLEGAWGMIVMVGIILPLFQFLPGADTENRYENTLDSFVKLSNSSFLCILTVTCFFSVLIYNIVGVMITAESSCIHHTFLDAMRTIFIWMISVLTFYVDPTHTFGEPWTPYSWMQMGGFGLLIMGQLIYDEIIRVPGVLYDIPESFCSEAQRAGSFATPKLRFVKARDNADMDRLSIGYKVLD